MPRDDIVAEPTSGAALGRLAFLPGITTAELCGGIGGYRAASNVTGHVYDWTEDTVFTPLPQVQVQQ